LTDYLDESLDADVREKLEKHIAECPNCWVICDTTRKTVEIYRGMDPYPIPTEMHSRLLAAIQKKKAAH
jgi:anti-sigma factor RsiW